MKINRFKYQYITYILDVNFSVSELLSSDQPRTGVGLLYLPSFTRPIIVVSCGRHFDAECYLQFPLNQNEYNDPIYLSEYPGGYSSVNINNDIVLFSGDSTSSGNTTSKIFRIMSDGTYELLWTASEAKPIRNGCFVINNSYDFIICGVDTNNSTLTQYYEYNGSWTPIFEFSTVNSYQPLTVGIYAKNNQILVGNRVNNSYYDTQFISSFLINNQNEIIREIQTYSPIVACYIGNIISSHNDDYIFIAGGQRNIRSQSFLLTSDNKKILLGPVMNGRNVIVFDFMQNGLNDIFIICVTDPHILLLQTSKGRFQQFSIENTIGNRNGEARGGVIGHLYNDNNTIQIIITDASEYNIPNQIYSFNYPIEYIPIFYRKHNIQL